MCRGNQFLEETLPWTALKKGSESEKAKARVTLVAVLEGVRIAAVALAPVVPQLSQRIHTQLGLEGDIQVCITLYFAPFSCLRGDVTSLLGTSANSNGRIGVKDPPKDHHCLCALGGVPLLPVCLPTEVRLFDDFLL